MISRNLQRVALLVVGLGIAVVCVVQAQSAPVPTTASTSTPDGTDAASDSTSQSAQSIGGSARWSAAGHDLSNTRNQPLERHIDRNNASTLTVKWVFKTEGDVSATPAVDDNAVYVPDSAGNLFAIDRRSGQAIWQHKIADYTGLANDIARATPAIAGDAIIVGDQGGRLNLTAGANVIAIDRRTGNKLWSTQVEANPSAVITQSAVVSGDNVYVGVSSIEETYAATVPGYT
ncbi:MAG TPA: PQQ-binding-like beta-propeller repeat protein, partial [Polyangiales bacterium]|nr:PQQ-binding-like beta-propeller repeat protein [Polyangiales bacterium]